MIVQIPQSRTQTQEVEFFMDTTVMDAWELDGIKIEIEICNTMFDCSFLAHPYLFPTIFHQFAMRL